MEGGKYKYSINNHHYVTHHEVKELNSGVSVFIWYITSLPTKVTKSYLFHDEVWELTKTNEQDAIEILNNLQGRFITVSKFINLADLFYGLLMLEPRVILSGRYFIELGALQEIFPTYFRDLAQNTSITVEEILPEASKKRKYDEGNSNDAETPPNYEYKLEDVVRVLSATGNDLLSHGKPKVARHVFQICTNVLSNPEMLDVNKKD